MAENTTTAATESEAVNTLNDERARRLADRASLYAAGKNPYPEHSDVTDHAADLLERYEGLAAEEEGAETVTVGGRIVAKRGQGKIMFLVLRDPSADIQLFCRVNDVEESSWEVLKSLDLGDIVEASGIVVRTKRGELSVAPRTARLLSKAVRPLPEKFHGLSDKETRYRQRYVDLIVNEDVRETFRKRSAIVSAFRRYMEDNGYMEVETPILQSIQGGATAKPFITHFNALNQENYLRIATELRPLPEKFHGLSDKETRYRQRYVDLIVNEDVRETFRKRSAIVSAFRRYMEDNGYMEVETPILQSIQGGATAKPFITHFNALNQENYLRIATELHLKRLLVGGYERVFEIGRIFRNEGMDLTHNPEFTTMEAYRAYSDLDGMKELAESPTTPSSPPWRPIAPTPTSTA